MVLFSHVRVLVSLKELPQGVLCALLRTIKTEQLCSLKGNQMCSVLYDKDKARKWSSIKARNKALSLIVRTEQSMNEIKQI